MIPGADLDRRNLLRLLAASAATAASPSLAASTMEQGLAALAKAALNTDSDSACRIGRRYLEAYPAERMAVWEDKELLEVLAMLGKSPCDTEAVRLQAIAQQRCDFESGDIVHVAGWVLSRREARLCAICALVTA